MPRKILLADDGPAIRQVVALTFLDRDYEILSVDNGDEALALVHQASPDLVLADVHMPGASGYEVCRQAKMLRADIPVLLLVGNLEPFSEAAAKECGANGMLRKPFDSKELLSRVDELIDSIDEAAETVAFEPPPDAVRTQPVETVKDEDAPSMEPAAAVAEADSAPDSTTGSGSTPRLSEEDVDRIARRVLELMSKQAFQELAWDVVPDLAEVVVRDRLKELEAQLEELG